MGARVLVRGLLIAGLASGVCPGLSRPALGWQVDAPPVGAPERFDAEGPEVLTRGPVHEAFAEPVVFDPEPGVVAPRRPPEPVEELPPDQRPEGRDVVWISGYWAWDEERDDFLWISGIWRDLPPGRQWMPGYWSEVEGGYQWTSGFWMPVDQGDVEYLETPPPQTLEVGPNVPAPSAEHFWTPGYWYWQDSRYLWRPGTWIPVQPEWVWVPPSYAYTPAGCVFVSGYWDHAIERRGMIFAPVYMPPVIYTQPAYVFTPAVSININILTSHFFCRPRYRHYYFGDYYAPGPRYGGIQPWFAYHESRRGYDPLFAHAAIINRRRDPGWNVRVREVYRERIERVDFRPPRTFRAQQELLRGRQDSDVRQFALARTLAQVEANRDTSLRVERLTRERREELGRRQQDLRAFREQRVRQEQEARQQQVRARLDRSQPAQGPRRLAMPPSPVLARNPAANTRPEAIQQLQERRRQAESERNAQSKALVERRQQRLEAESTAAQAKRQEVRERQENRQREAEAQQALQKNRRNEAAQQLRERAEQQKAANAAREAAGRANREQAARTAQERNRQQREEAAQRADRQRAEIEANRQQRQEQLRRIQPAPGGARGPDQPGQGRPDLPRRNQEALQQLQQRRQQTEARAAADQARRQEALQRQQGQRQQQAEALRQAQQQRQQQAEQLRRSQAEGQAQRLRQQAQQEQQRQAQQQQRQAQQRRNEEALQSRRQQALQQRQGELQNRQQQQQQKRSRPNEPKPGDRPRN